MGLPVWRRWLVLVALPAACALKTGWREVRSTEPWVFLERFCFEPTGEQGEGSNKMKDHAHFKFKIRHQGSGQLLLYFGTGTNDFRKIYKQSYTKTNLQQRHRLATVAYRITANRDGETVVTGSWSRKSYLKSGSPRYLFVAYSNYNKNCNARCQTAQYDRSAPAQQGGVGDLNATEWADAVTAVELDFGWYVAPVAAAANVFCNEELSSDPFCMGPVRMDYNFHFTNGRDTLVREFSFDENTVFPCALAFFARVRAASPARAFARVSRGLRSRFRVGSRAS